MINSSQAPDNLPRTRLGEINYTALRTPEQKQQIYEKMKATRKANKEKKERELKEAAERKIKLQFGIDELEKKIARLEERHNNLRKMDEMFRALSELTGKTIFQAREIIANSFPRTRVIGVYFLIKENDIVYVGQSTNVFARIVAHESKDYDSFAYIPCEQEQLDNLETIYIHLFTPKLNGKHPSGQPISPVSFDALIGKKQIKNTRRTNFRRQ
jgi:predicted RNase H-like nuclease (RuvC/YqgF family)